MVRQKFIDIQSGGGVIDTDKARCLASRYNAGVVRHKAERSGVFYTITDEDSILENWGGNSWLVV